LSHQAVAQLGCLLTQTLDFAPCCVPQINGLASKGEYKASGAADQSSMKSLYTASYVY